MKNEIKNFIIEQIKYLSGIFYNISFKYGYDDLTGQNIVEVDPESEYKSENYMLAEANIIEEFISRFPNDELLFVSNDKYIKVKEPIFAKEALVKSYSVPIETSVLVDYTPFYFPAALPLATSIILDAFKHYKISENGILAHYLNDSDSDALMVNVIDRKISKTVWVSVPNNSAVMPNTSPISNDSEFALAA